MISLENKIKFSYSNFIIAALISGFILIPLHEIGHVICHWLTGNPAGMSYARDYMLSNGEFTFWGVSGGLLLPVVISIVFICIIINTRKYNEILIPLIVLGSSERAIQYLFGSTPSDERLISEYLLLNIYLIKFIFVVIPIVINAILIIYLRKEKYKTSRIIFVMLITLIAYIVMASFGLFVIERYLFPEQYLIQFGKK